MNDKLPPMEYGYPDCRVWDDAQRRSVQTVLTQLQKDLDTLEDEQIRKLRSDTLWLFDVLFPTGFTYKANRSPSEDVAVYMHGDGEATV